MKISGTGHMRQHAPRTRLALSVCKKQIFLSIVHLFALEKLSRSRFSIRFQAKIPILLRVGNSLYPRIFFLLIRQISMMWLMMLVMLWIKRVMVVW